MKTSERFSGVLLGGFAIAWSVGVFTTGQFRFGKGAHRTLVTPESHPWAYWGAILLGLGIGGTVIFFAIRKKSPSRRHKRRDIAPKQLIRNVSQEESLAINADQLTEIRSSIREAIDGAPDTCVTLQVEGQSEKWIQIVDRTINAAYPHTNDPNERLKSWSSKPAVKVVSWEAGKFATFEFTEFEVTAIARWVDAYFVGVLSCAPGEYHLDIASEQV